MCIIAIKEKGVAMPDLETLNNMWENNPDGAGYMFPIDGKVHIRKGFMEFDELIKDLDELAKTVDLKKIPIVMHFRIGTHGNRRNPANTHPFPVSSNRKELKALRFETKVGFAHNGIISAMRSDSDISDTMVYSIDVLSKLKSGNRKFYKDKRALDVIQNTIEGSRMVFMDGDGYISRIGDWVKDKSTGMVYSNGTYAASLWGYYKPLPRKSNVDAWESYLGTGCNETGACDDDWLDGDWDVKWDGRCYKRVSFPGAHYIIILEDGTEVFADEYAEYMGAGIYVDEFGLAYAYFKGMGMEGLEEVYDVIDLHGEHVVAGITYTSPIKK